MEQSQNPWTEEVREQRYFVNQIEHISVEGITTAGSQAAALEGAKHIMATLAKDKWAAVRNWPEADTWRDHNKDCDVHKGYVRFTYVDAPGEWHDSPWVVKRASAA